MATFIILFIILYHPPIFIVTYVFCVRSDYWYKNNLISISAEYFNFDIKYQFFWRILVKYIWILWACSFKTYFAAFFGIHGLIKLFLLQSLQKITYKNSSQLRWEYSNFFCHIQVLWSGRIGLIFIEFKI